MTLFNRKILIHIYVDSKSLFGIMVKKSITTENQLTTDLLAFKVAYQLHKVSNIGLTSSQYNPIDNLTNIEENRAIATFIETNKPAHPVA